MKKAFLAAAAAMALAPMALAQQCYVDENGNMVCPKRQGVFAGVGRALSQPFRGATQAPQVQFSAPASVGSIGCSASSAPQVSYSVAAPASVGSSGCTSSRASSTSAPAAAPAIPMSVAPPASAPMSAYPAPVYDADEQEHNINAGPRQDLAAKIVADKLRVAEWRPGANPTTHYSLWLGDRQIGCWDVKAKQYRSLAKDQWGPVEKAPPVPVPPHRAILAAAARAGNPKAIAALSAAPDARLASAQTTACPACGPNCTCTPSGVCGPDCPCWGGKAVAATP